MHNQLYNLIGQQIVHEGKVCILIEIMDDGPSLVFQCNSEKKIQCNQHGNAHRKSSPTYTIHCLNEQKDDLHPVLKSLIPDTEQIQLMKDLVN